jgi:DNA-binding response OmpR family regulator
MTRILLIEDDEALCAVIERWLRADGHDVVIASAGEDAMKVLENDRPFRLVIVDIVLPGISGLEVIRALRRSAVRPSVIAMSGRDRVSTGGYLEIAGLFGAVRTLEKPFNRDDLLVAVHQALSGQLPDPKPGDEPIT